MLTVGTIVRYHPNWCSDGERKYIHLVKEVGLLNPCTNQPTRVLIETLNTNLTLRPTEVVEECMLEDIGMNAADFIN
jgi:hypothetical protein